MGWWPNGREGAWRIAGSTILKSNCRHVGLATGSGTRRGGLSRGFVYILVNASMPGLVKIGRTQGHPDERAGELSRPTGVPSPHIHAFSAEVSDCELVESLVFRRLKDRRAEPGREFFRVPLAEAIKVVSEVAADYPSRESAARFPSKETAGETPVICRTCRYVARGVSTSRQIWVCPKCGETNQGGATLATSAERFRDFCANPECAHAIVHEAHVWAWVCPACGKSNDALRRKQEGAVMRICARPECAALTVVPSSSWAWMCPRCGSTNDVKHTP